MHRIAAVVAGLSLAFVGTSATIAATINVPGDHATIQGAINASSNGDVIAIAAGTYYEHSLNPGGKAITIQGTRNSDGTLETTIDAQQGGSVFVMNSGEGGGTVIRDMVITGGSASRGGGIYCNDSSPTITDCTITNNMANDSGGGIHCWKSRSTITGCTISNNWAAGAAGLGGGIFTFTGVNTIIDCTIEDNTAPGGGGLFTYSGDNTIIDCTISGNAPYNYGGSPSTPLTIITSAPASPSGACCLNGTCITATESDCTASGGFYAGDDVTCADAGCATPPVTGACCVASGCVANINDDCTALGGTWLGEDASCDDCAPTCQGDANADGTVDVFDLLKVIDGWGTCP